MTKLKLAIASYDDFKARTMAIARGEMEPGAMLKNGPQSRWAPDAPAVPYPQAIARKLTTIREALQHG